MGCFLWPSVLWPSALWVILLKLCFFILTGFLLYFMCSLIYNISQLNYYLILILILSRFCDYFDPSSKLRQRIKCDTLYWLWHYLNICDTLFDKHLAVTSLRNKFWHCIDCDTTSASVTHFLTNICDTMSLRNKCNTTLIMTLSLRYKCDITLIMTLSLRYKCDITFW